MNYTNDIRAFVVTNFLYGDVAQLKDSTSFLNDGILDSTGILELVTFLESTYHIEIKSEELLPSNLDSVINVARFLEKKIEALSSQPANYAEPGKPVTPPYMFASEPNDFET